MRYYRQSLWSVANVITFALFPILLTKARYGGFSWAPLIGLLFLMFLFRRFVPDIARREVPRHLAFVILAAFGALWSYLNQGASLKEIGWMLFLFLLLWGFDGLTRPYWEIRDDSLIQRRLFGRKVLPMSQIVYAGPVKGAAGRNAYFAHHVLIQTASGERMLVDTPRRESFLEEMRKRLPQVTVDS